MKRHLIKLSAVAGLLSLPFSFAYAADTQPAAPAISAAQPAATTNYLQLSYNLTHNTNLSPKAVEMAFAGYEWALKTKKVHNKDILTIVDFSVSSALDRMYVINVKTGEILMALPVTHGKNSGANSHLTKSFSNENNSLQSSIGVFLTANTYHGKHGFSLRIHGLEASNSNAMVRNVVVHPASYASAEYIKKNGRAGTSWGCFAVDPRESKQLIAYIKGGSVIYAYGDSKQYMASTKILNHNQAATLG